MANTTTFIAGKAQVQQARITHVLEKQFMYCGRPMSRAQIIEKRVNDGWFLQETEFDGLCLVNPDDNDCILSAAIVTKTGIDYAQHLIGTQVGTYIASKN